MRWVFSVLLVLLSIHMNGQQAYVDSLANIVATTENDKLKVQVLIELCYSYYSIDAKTGIEYGLEVWNLEHKCNMILVL